MIVENVRESYLKPRSGDINLSCLQHFNSFSSLYAIILSCPRHYPPIIFQDLIRINTYPLRFNHFFSFGDDRRAQQRITEL